MNDEKLEPNILSGFIPILKELRSIKRPLDTAPTFTPQNFLDQIQFYKNGSTYRTYYYIDGVWKYSTLT